MMYYNGQILVFIIIFSYYFCKGQGQNLGLCGDPMCSTLLGEGQTHSVYVPLQHGYLGFAPGTNVLIYLIKYGPNKELLGVEINGQRGYVPSSLVRITRDLTNGKILNSPSVDFLLLNSVRASSLYNSEVIQNPSSYLPGVVPTQSQPIPSLKAPSIAQNFAHMSPSENMQIQQNEFLNMHQKQFPDVPSFTESQVHSQQQMSIDATNIQSIVPPVQPSVQIQASQQVNTAPHHFVSQSENLLSLNTASHVIAPSPVGDLSVGDPSQNLPTGNNIDPQVQISSPSLPLNKPDSSQSVVLQETKASDLPPNQQIPLGNIELSLTQNTDYDSTLSMLHKLGLDDQALSDSDPTLEDTSKTREFSLFTEKNNEDASANSLEASESEVVESKLNLIEKQLDNIGSLDFKDENEISSDEEKGDLKEDKKGGGKGKEIVEEIGGGNQIVEEISERNEKENEIAEEKENEIVEEKENEIVEEKENEIAEENENEIAEEKEKENEKEDENKIQHQDNYEEPPLKGISILSDKSPEMNASQETSLKESVLINNVEEKIGDILELNVNNVTSDDSFTVKPSRSILQENENLSALDGETENANDVDDSTVDESKTMLVETVTSSILYDAFINFVSALRTFLDFVISFMPEPVYSYLMNLSSAGISSRAVVFTALMTIPSLCLFLSVFYLKKNSKEQSVLGQLSNTEHALYLATTERDLLKENVETLQQQVTELELNLEDEKSLSKSLQSDLEGHELTHQNVSAEQKEHLGVIRNLKKQIKDYENTISDLEKSLKETSEAVDQVQEELDAQKKNNTQLTEKNTKLTDELQELKSEKETFASNEKLYLDKIAEYEEYCNQLCQDAELRHTKITEISDELSRYTSLKEQLETDIESKNTEIEALKSVIQNFDVIEKLKESGDASEKIIEEKIANLLDITSVQNKMKKVQIENEVLSEKLNERIKECDEMKVVNLELNSEVDKLKALKEQAVEEKIDIERKLEILEKYFKDKEVQLQKELGTQLTARQQKEVDVSQAERTIYLLKEENTSFREQVKTLKQEIEETERNLKKQITAQEEIAHKNWVAARAAERNVDKLKQEIAQFRQRVTLLEREREDSLHNLSHDGSISGDFKPEFGLPPRHLPPPPMMHPMLPPNMPPPMMPPPPFMPPFDPMMPPPPRRPPWDKNLPDARRFHTPPFFDKEGGKPSPSGESSHSRNSSPLPDFHNVPPPPGGWFHEGPIPPSSARFVSPPSSLARKEMDSRSGHKGPRREPHNISRDRESTRSYDADV